MCLFPNDERVLDVLFFSNNMMLYYSNLSTEVALTQYAAGKALQVELANQKVY